MTKQAFVRQEIYRFQIQAGLVNRFIKRKKVMTVVEAAQKLRVSERTIRVKLRSGTLKSNQLMFEGKMRHMITEEHINEYLQNLNQERAI